MAPNASGLFSRFDQLQATRLMDEPNRVSGEYVIFPFGRDWAFARLRSGSTFDIQRPSNASLDFFSDLDEAVARARGEVESVLSDRNRGHLVVLVDSGKASNVYTYGEVSSEALDSFLESVVNKSPVSRLYRDTELPISAAGPDSPTNFALAETARPPDEAPFAPTISFNPEGPPQLDVYVDPGSAPPELIAELYAALSDLDRASGGAGLELSGGDMDIYEFQGQV